MDRCALVGARLVDPESALPCDETLLIEDGRIADRLPPGRPVAPEWRRVALPDRLIAPGFIDVHFHGELFGAPTAGFGAALDRAARAMPATGTTAFLATTVSWSDDEIRERVSELTRLVGEGTGRDGRDGAACLGLHLEGPWLNGAVPGAMAHDCLRAFHRQRDGDVLDRAGDALRMVTLAPEIDGAGALLDELARRGVVASLGHSQAGPDSIDAGIGRGLRHVTHLFNAMGPIHHRAPGVAGSVLAEDRLTCDLICDGHHVHPDMVRIAARTLGERLVLITDRVDLPDTAENGPRREGGHGGDPARLDPDAPARLADGTIAGSQLGQARAVHNAMAFAGLGLCEAVAAVTLRPARLLGIERERGTLRPGGRADLTILDDTGRVVETWIGGQPVYVDRSADV